MAEPLRPRSLHSVVREFDRVAVDALVVLLTGVPRLADYAVNLSEGGVRVRSASPVPAGVVSAARLALPGATGPLDAKVRVAWAREETMGLQFLAPTAQLRDLLRWILGRRPAAPRR